MRIIAKKTAAIYWARNPRSKPSLEIWIKVVSGAKWQTMNDVQTTLPNAVVLNADRVKFEIGGGKFRLIAAINFKAEIVFVKFIGTHAEYDKIDALTVSHY